MFGTLVLDFILTLPMGIDRGTCNLVYTNQLIRLDTLILLSVPVAAFV